MKKCQIAFLASIGAFAPLSAFAHVEHGSGPLEGIIILFVLCLPGIVSFMIAALALAFRQHAWCLSRREWLNASANFGLLFYIGLLLGAGMSVAAEMAFPESAGEIHFLASYVHGIGVLWAAYMLKLRSGTDKRRKAEREDMLKKSTFGPPFHLISE